MTLYWWTHWFWITSLTLKLFVVVLSLSWGMAGVQGMSLPFVHTSVQNGHQNGPYVTKSLDIITEKINTQRTNSKELLNYHTANYQEISHYSTEEDATTGETSSSVSRASDRSTTEAHQAIPTVESPPKSRDISPFKTAPFSPGDGQLQTVPPVPLVETSDNDDTSSGFVLPNLARTENIGTGTDGDSKIIWVSTQPTHIAEKKKKTDSSKEELHSKETLVDEPMNDGPYSQTSSVINSTSVRSKSKPVETVSTTEENENVLHEEKISVTHRGKTVNRERTLEEKAAMNATAHPVVFVTPSAINDSTEDNRGEESSADVPPEEGNLKANTTEESTGSDDDSVLEGGSSEVVRSLSSVNGDAWRVPAAANVLVSKEVREEGGMNAASIAGIALGIVAAAAMVGAVSYGLYRRRYLNKPQTLNDSNPDSSGYLDDSTLRENSEEMYSLDNDSFLNSLEAMTIQNYWTDSVKHTKL